MVGDTSTTFWRNLNSKPNADFEKVSDGYAVVPEPPRRLNTVTPGHRPSNSHAACLRDGIELPEKLAGPGVISADEAFFVLIIGAARVVNFRASTGDIEAVPPLVARLGGQAHAELNSQ